MPMDLTNKRFLITHTQICNIMGSTMVVLDLARFLKSQSASVEVFASWYSGLAGAEYEQAGIPVCTDETRHFDITDYDYVWVNSQVLPVSIVDQLRDVPREKAPYFIFNHMSALDLAPDEQPYMYQFEEKVSSLSLFVSQETKDALDRFYESPEFPTALFPNPTGSEYCSVGRPGETLKRIAVVTNHLPEDLAQAADMLRQQGLEVVHIGFGGTEKVIGPDDIASYDAVISIGKTVQYCLLAGTPIFVYDYFGGFGYLSDENFSAAESRNFSGRGGSQLSPEELAQAILSGYADARSWSQKNAERFAERYTMASILPRVLEKAERRPWGELSEAFLSSLKASQRFGFRYYARWVEMDYRGSIIKELNSQIDSLNQTIDERDHAIESLVSEADDLRRELESTRDELRETTDALSALRASETYKVGSAIVFPFRKAKELGRDLSKRLHSS